MSVRTSDSGLPKLDDGPCGSVGKISVWALCALFLLCTLVPILIVLRSGMGNLFDLSDHLSNVEKPAAHEFSDEEIRSLQRFAWPEAAPDSDKVSADDLKILRILARSALRRAKYLP